MNKKWITNGLKSMVMLCVIVSITVTGTLVYGASSKDVTKTFTDTKKVTNLVNQLTTYLGYQLLYTDTSYENEKIVMDGKFMLESVGMGMSNATGKKIQKLAKNVYGKKPAIKNLTLYKDSEEFYNDSAFAGRLEDGSVLVMVGDWGIAGPVMKVKTITKLSKKTYRVTANLYYVDNETQESTLEGTIKFRIKANESSKYGYVITSITVNRAS